MMLIGSPKNLIGGEAYRQVQWAPNLNDESAQLLEEC